jgi:hypothetical protein
VKDRLFAMSPSPFESCHLPESRNRANMKKNIFQFATETPIAVAADLVSKEFVTSKVSETARKIMLIIQCRAACAHALGFSVYATAERTISQFSPGCFGQNA